MRPESDEVSGSRPGRPARGLLTSANADQLAARASAWTAAQRSQNALLADCGFGPVHAGVVAHGRRWPLCGPTAAVAQAALRVSTSRASRLAAGEPPACCPHPVRSPPP